MTNGVILQAGANVSLTRTNPLLSEVVVGFGWRTVDGNGPQVDLVPSVIAVGDDDMAVSDDHFVFFNQLATPDDSVRYVTGEDAEQVELSLASVPDTVKKLVFVVYVDPDIRQPGNFGSVRNAYIRLADREDTAIVRFNLPNPDLSITAMIFGEVYRHNGEWKFRAIGQGYTTGISGVAGDFGVTL